MIKINLGLDNVELYSGCEVETVAGRKNLKTPIADAVNIVGDNINKLVSAISANDRKEVLLTGAMAVWAYLVVFHAVVHSFTRVYYSDGKSDPVLVAAHGS